MDRYLENNWVLRILALVLAIGVWSQVYPPSNPVVTRVITGVPVSVVNVKPGTKAVPKVTMVTVDVRGAQSVVSGLHTNSVTAQIDVRRSNPSLRSYPVAVYLPAGSEAMSVLPKQVAVQISWNA